MNPLSDQVEASWSIYGQGALRERLNPSNRFSVIELIKYGNQSLKFSLAVGGGVITERAEFSLNSNGCMVV